MQISKNECFEAWCKKAIEKITLFEPVERTMRRKGGRAFPKTGAKGRKTSEGIAKST